MTKLEQVIKALQLCRYDPDPGQECKFLVSCDICPYWKDEGGCREIDLFNDALELLKEKKPRVIDISEIYTAKKLDVWIEDKSDNVHPLMLIETEMTDKSQTAFFYPMLVRPIKAYGKTWRCWTARPTDEQREATPWDEPPKEEVYEDHV